MHKFFICDFSTSLQEESGGRTVTKPSQGLRNPADQLAKTVLIGQNSAAYAPMSHVIPAPPRSSFGTKLLPQLISLLEQIRLLLDIAHADRTAINHAGHRGFDEAADILKGTQGIDSS
jgi:hypothetical protein